MRHGSSPSVAPFVMTRCKVIGPPEGRTWPHNFETLGRCPLLQLEGCSTGTVYESVLHALQAAHA